MSNSERAALTALACVAIWTFVGLPIIYHGAEHSEGIKPGEWLVGGATVALVGATAALWWATRRLVLGAEETAQRQLRAYVFIEEIKLRKKAGPQGEILGVDLMAVWKNFGSTPALNVRTGGNCVFWHQAELPPWFPFPDFPALFGPTGGDVRLIAQGSSVHHGTGFIPEGAFEAIKKGWISVFCWGWVEYTDLFGKTHKARYCWRARSLGYNKDDTKWPDSLGFHYYERNNCVDDECEQEDRQRPPVPAEHAKKISNNRNNIGWLLWFDEQRPTTYERAPDGTPHDQTPRDQFGVKLS